MTAISAPSIFNVFQDIPSLNSAANDYTSDNGVRLCCTVYIDIPMNTADGKLGRKEIFNKLRSICNKPLPRKQQPKSLSGLTVEEHSTLEPYVCNYLGVNMGTLRSAIWFQRGALPIDLILKVQNVIGETIISDKDITAAFTKKSKSVKAFSKTYPFVLPDLS